jgi:hypothetical protein
MTGLPAPVDGLSARARRDLAIRRAVFSDAIEVAVPADGLEFWSWYVDVVRCGRPFRTATLAADSSYPPATAGAALWYSGGVESTYTRAVLADRGIEPTLLKISDFSVFTGPDRRHGQIHFLCAVVAASLGYSPIYLGMERQDLLLGSAPFTRGYVERHPLFAEKWSAYQPEHEVRTVCADLNKEQIIQWLDGRGIRITGTCDRLSGGAWCGDCYKCFEAFYTAKAVDIDLGIRLTRSAFERYHGEYRRYVDSGFTDNFNNANQHYVRLQITYGLVFDPAVDCGEDPTCGC